MKKLLVLTAFFALIGMTAFAQGNVGQGNINGNQPTNDTLVGHLELDFCDNCAAQSCGASPTMSYIFTTNSGTIYYLFINDNNYMTWVEERWQHITKTGVENSGAPVPLNGARVKVIGKLKKSSGTCPYSVWDVDEIIFL